MFCSKCGSLLPEGAMFCSNCGSKVVYSVSQEEKVSDDVVEMASPASVQSINEPVNNKVNDLLLGAFVDKWDWFPAESVKWMKEEFKRCDVDKANKILECDFTNPSKMFGLNMSMMVMAGYMIFLQITKMNNYMSSSDKESFLVLIVAFVIYSLFASVYVSKKVGNWKWNIYSIKSDTKKSNLSKLSNLLGSNYKPL